MKRNPRPRMPQGRNLQTYMSLSDYASIVQTYKISTCKSLSEYTREKLLGHRVNIKYRNESLDDFLTEMIPLKRALLTLIADLKVSGDHKMACENAALCEKIDQIIDKLNLIYDKCSRE